MGAGFLGAQDERDMRMAGRAAPHLDRRDPMITVECQRVGCDASFKVGLETDWTGWPHAGIDPRADWPSVVVALPQGWTIEVVGSGDPVIHCPEHAATASTNAAGA